MLEIGSLVDGKYKILNVVGKGGMSVVYLAMNERANKQWAIKEVRKDGVQDFWRLRISGNKRKPFVFSKAIGLRQCKAGSRRNPTREN